MKVAYCPVCGFVSPSEYLNDPCMYCKYPMQLTEEDQDYFSSKSKFDLNLLKKIVFDQYVKNNPLLNEKKCKRRLERETAEDVRMNEIYSDPQKKAEWERYNESLLKPTCPKCGSHEISAVNEGLFFHTTYRVCLRCGHKYL